MNKIWSGEYFFLAKSGFHEKVWSHEHTSTSSQGEGWRSDQPSIKKRYKGPGVCSLCCGVCCGAAQELVEYLFLKGVIDITCKVIHHDFD